MEIDQTLLSKANPPFANPRTRDFLQAVIAEGGAIITKDFRDKTEGEIRARQQNLIGAYYTSQATYYDLGQIYKNEKTSKPVTAQAVQLRIDRGMRRFWRKSSDKIKETFPWETIPLGKPQTLTSKIKLSLIRGGAAVEVLQGIQQGKSYFQIKKDRRSKQDIRRSRGMLKRWGFSGDLPYGALVGEARSNFIGQLEAAKIPEDIRALFDQIKNGHSTYVTILRGNLPLTRFGDVLSACGFNRNDGRNKHFFIEELEANGVVVGINELKIENGPRAGQIQRYYFLRTKDVPSAEEILRNSSLLARFHHG